MAKIGILVFTNLEKKRGTRKNHFFDSFEFIGLNTIINEIDKKKHEIKFISETDIKECDFALISVISYMDIYNIISKINPKKKGKCKIIIGGAGLTNIRIIKDYIDIAVFGRGEGIINEILENIEFPNVWRKEKDYNFKKKYIFGDLKYLIKNNFYEEKSIGCQKKCLFCQYSWKNKYYGCSENYQSGIANHEDFIKTLDWEKTRSTAVTALDCSTEKGREIINKPISNIELIEIFKKAYMVKTEKRLSLKIFNIVGFSWEKEDIFKELKNVFKECEINKKINDIFIFFSLNHFVPMPFTPMECEPINFIDYREITRKNFVLHKGNNFYVRFMAYQQSPIPSLEQTFINRAYESDLDLFQKIFLSKKYNSLKTKEKINVFKNIIPQKFYKELNSESEKPWDYIQTQYEYKKVIPVFKNNK